MLKGCFLRFKAEKMQKENYTMYNTTVLVLEKAVNFLKNESNQCICNKNKVANVKHYFKQLLFKSIGQFRMNVHAS